jgi:hypothetical protein
MGRSSEKKTWLIPGVRTGAYATVKIRDQNRPHTRMRASHPNACVTGYREAV